MTAWQFLPEFIFPMLGSLAFLCWVAPHNHVANFVGAGFGGMGFLNLSLDWSNISARYSLFLTPWWTQVVMFAGFACSTWILLPAAKFGNLGEWKLHLNSNRLFLGKFAIVYILTRSIISDGFRKRNIVSHYTASHASGHSQRDCVR